jgi:hypothetical protein
MSGGDELVAYLMAVLPSRHWLRDVLQPGEFYELIRDGKPLECILAGRAVGHLPAASYSLALALDRTKRWRKQQLADAAEKQRKADEEAGIRRQQDEQRRREVERRDRIQSDIVGAGRAREWREIQLSAEAERQWQEREAALRRQAG